MVLAEGRIRQHEAQHDGSRSLVMERFAIKFIDEPLHVRPVENFDWLAHRVDGYMSSPRASSAALLSKARV